MGNSTGFAYDIGERVGSSNPPGQQHHWQHHTGKKKADGSEVSIFRLDKVSCPKLRMEAGLHGFQKMKTMRHPYILQYLDGADLDKELVVVTEPVKPVKEWINTLSGDNKEDQLAWGIRCILSALDFLNGQNSLTHGYVCTDTIFVTATGDWKLGGLDLVCEWRPGGRDVFHFQTHEGLVPQEYRAPERRSNNMDSMFAGQAGAVDIWALGAVLEEVLSGSKGALGSLLRRMLADAPKSRPSAAQLLRQSYFSSKELINTLVFLETFSLKEDSDKVRFFEGLAGQLGRFPSEVGIYKVLPVFRDYVRVDGSAQQVAANPSQRNILLSALPCVLEISKGLEAQQFMVIVEPLLLPLFEITDRALRAQLLQQLQHLAPKFSDTTLNGRVFENVIIGFQDSSPYIRELTLKSMICLTDRLNEKNMNDRLLRCLSKLHQDPEPSIRTNTTIFLGRIAAQLKEGTRVRVLLPAFLKACRDPFPHARLAGLKAASACSGYFDPINVATKVIPTIAGGLVDPDTAVREAAFQCHDAYMRVLVLNSQKLKEDEEKRRLESAALAEKGGLASSSSGSESVMSGLASWAATKLTSSPTRPLAATSSVQQPPPASANEAASSSKATAGGATSGGQASHQGWDDGDEDFFDTHEGDLTHGGGTRRNDGTSSSLAHGDGWDDEDDIGAADGWGLDDEEESHLVTGGVANKGGASGVRGSLRAGSLGSVGSSVSSADAESLQAAGRATAGTMQQPQPKPLAADDLFSMLGDDTSKSGSQLWSSHHGGLAVTPGGRSSSSLIMTTPKATSGATATIPSAGSSDATPTESHIQAGISSSRRSGAGVERKGKLQARKMQLTANEWDDF